MRLEEVMSTDVETVKPDESAEVAWNRMRVRRVHHLVVLDRKRVVGIISDRDLGGSKGAQLRKGHTVEELMTPNAAIAKPTTTLRQAANLMRGRSIGCLPVLKGDKLVGMVTVTDLLETMGRGRLRPPPAKSRMRRMERITGWPRPGVAPH